MNIKLVALLSLALVGGVGGAGCALSSDGEAPEEDSATDESELRKLKTGELVGSIACGETKRVRHTGSPTYRALSIAAKRGQTLDFRVSAPGHDATAWLTSASNATLASNNNAAAGTKDARITYVAKSNMTHNIVFREVNYEDNIDFDVTLTCPGGASDAGADSGNNDGGNDAGPAPSDDPFDPTSCAGPTISRAEAIARIGAGNAFREVAPARLLQARKRSCNSVTGCSAWGATAPASHTYYMASGGDNYNRERQYNAHLVFSVQGNDINAVVEDISNSAHCPACTPSGFSQNLTTGAIDAHYGDAALFIYYPRWTHGSSGFRLQDTWASVPMGPAATTTFKVTNSCTRVSVLSKDQQTEYGILYRY